MRDGPGLSRANQLSAYTRSSNVRINVLTFQECHRGRFASFGVRARADFDETAECPVTTVSHEDRNPDQMCAAFIRNVKPVINFARIKIRVESRSHPPPLFPV